MSMRAFLFALLAFVIAVPSAHRVAAQDRQSLRIYFIDVEGGQATLLVSPTGESMLVDTGFPANGGRDADRIAATAKQAGVSRIDYLVVTHYHADHVGGVPAIAARLPIRTFVDHGPSVEHGDQPDKLYNSYLDVRKNGRHLQVKPGDTVPIAGLDVRVVSSAGDVLTAPLAGAGAPNPDCRDFKPMDEDKTENARSVGMVIQYGRFRILDLGDLTWNKEHDLVCPNNTIGTVDVYLTTHHGTPASGAPVIVRAVHPRVAVMNNGAKKGGSAQAWTTVHESPGLEDFWQLHHAVDAGADHNTPERFIANVDETTAYSITIVAERDGSFVVTNTRNGFSRSYPSRR
jgi:beta-lactamase superfamily II metal-dependent hydrolase